MSFNNNIFPFIEVDSFPSEGTSNLNILEIPRLRIFADGDGGHFVLFEQDPRNGTLTFKRGNLSKDDLQKIFDELEKSNFYNMDEFYEEAVIDGGVKSITVNNIGKIKTVKHMRYTGKSSNDAVPESYTALHKWLFDYVNAKNPLVQRYQTLK